MPLQADATPDERSSPFFKDYEQIADAWNEVARMHGGTVEGVYNAYHFEATLKCRVREYDVSAIGKREMMPPAFTMSASRIVGQSIVAVSIGRRMTATFQVQPRTLWNRSMAACTGKAVGHSLDGSFLIVASDRGLLVWVLEKHAVINELMTYGLQSMALHRRGELVLHFKDLITQSMDLQKVLQLSTRMVKQTEHNPEQLPVG